MTTDDHPSATDRVRCAGLIAGPAAFIGAWVVAGARTEGYSPVRDHISDLAAVGAPTRPLMNLGFTAFAVAIGLAASPMRRRVGTPGAVVLGANAVVSIAIMLAPLGRSTQGDQIHGVAAGLGYLVLAATAPAAAPALAKRSRPMALTASAVGAMSLASLAGSLVMKDRSGLWQRVGITTTDAWLITMGLLAVTRSGRTGT